VKAGTVAVGFLDPGQWSHCFGQSLIDLYLTDSVGSRRMVPDGRQLRKHCAAGGLVEGRNEIARKFLQSECEWLFMVDSDMGFGPDTVDRLIASADPVARPVVGGLCFSLRREKAGDHYGQKYVVVPTLFEFVETSDSVGFRSILDYPQDALTPVGGTGAACLIIHRSALEAVAAKFGEHWFDVVTHPTGQTTFSEDLSFCVRLAAVGLPVFVDTSVRTTHDKHGVFLDEEEFCRSLAVASLEAAAPAAA
jgi:hypothetical protein